MRAFLLVAVGAAVGATVRWGVGHLLDRPADAFPWATLVVNVAGCLAAGLALRWVVRGSDRWLATVTGLLGGLTTFSAFSVETRALLDAGRTGLAVTYAAASVLGGVIAVELGRGGGAPG